MRHDGPDYTMAQYHDWIQHSKKYRPPFTSPVVEELEQVTLYPRHSVANGLTTLVNQSRSHFNIKQSNILTARSREIHEPLTKAPSCLASSFSWNTLARTHTERSTKTLRPYTRRSKSSNTITRLDSHGSTRATRFEGRGDILTVAVRPTRSLKAKVNSRRARPTFPNESKVRAPLRKVAGWMRHVHWPR